jgi:hypothetical protein
MTAMKKRKRNNISFKMTQKSKESKQLTLDNLPFTPNKIADRSVSRKTEKQIVITEISALTKIDEISLKIGFRLVPSKTAFSKVQLNLWFNNQQISYVSIRIPQGPLAVDEFELTPVLDMKGIPAGSYIIKVEMCELWSSEERLFETLKELKIDYVPQTRQSRFVKVPTIRSIAGKDLAIITEPEKTVYKEIEKTIKKEQISKRDDW